MLFIERRDIEQAQPEEKRGMCPVGGASGPGRRGSVLRVGLGAMIINGCQYHD